MSEIYCRPLILYWSITEVNLSHKVSNIRIKNLYLETKILGLIFNSTNISCLTAESQVQTICLPFSLLSMSGNEK